MSMLVGLQLYTVRDEMEKDFYGTLKKVKEFGYEGVEFAGLFGKKAEEVKKMLDELSLIPISAHVPINELLDDSDKTFKTYKDIGVSYIAIPYLPEEYRPQACDFKDTLNKILSICKKAKEYDIQMLYHNHDFEFEVINNEYYLDTIYNNISEELLQTEIDTCWVNVAGENPTEYLMKYKGRAPIVHLKDFVMKGKVNKDNLYELIGDAKTINKDEEDFAFRPVGYGVQDFDSILDASEKVGAKWVIVEQDRPAKGQTSIESAKLSIDYLRKIN